MSKIFHLKKWKVHQGTLKCDRSVHRLWSLHGSRQKLRMDKSRYAIISLLTAQKIHNERMLLRLINKNFHYSFAGIQSVLHHKSEPTGSILAIANGGHKRADHNIWFDKFCDIYNQSAGFYVNGCRAYV